MKAVLKTQIMIHYFYYCQNVQQHTIVNYKVNYKNE